VARKGLLALVIGSLALLFFVGVLGAEGPLGPSIEDLTRVAKFQPWPAAGSLKVVVYGDRPEVYINAGAVELLGLSGQVTIRVTDGEKGYTEDGTILIPQSVLFGEGGVVFREASLFVSKTILLMQGYDPGYVEYYERELLALDRAMFEGYSAEKDEGRRLKMYDKMAEVYRPLLVAFSEPWFDLLRRGNFIPGRMIVPPTSTPTPTVTPTPTATPTATPVWGVRVQRAARENSGSIGSGLLGLFAAAAVGYGLRYALKLKRNRGLVAEGVTRGDLEFAIANCREKLGCLKKLVAQVADEEVREWAGQIGDTAEKILASVQKDPRDLRSVRIYLVSYLEAVVKVLQRYVDLAREDISSARETLRKMPSLLRDVVDSLGQLHVMILSNNVRDFDAQIEALWKRMELDGFVTNGRRESNGEEKS